MLYLGMGEHDEEYQTIWNYFNLYHNMCRFHVRVHHPAANRD